MITIMLTPEQLAAIAQQQAMAVPPPVYQAPPAPIPQAPTPQANAGVPAEIAGLQAFSSTLPWVTPGQINRHAGGSIDASNVWLAHFTPTANSKQPGRIQVADAASQSIFRTYLLYRDADGLVLAREEGISAEFTYWVGPGNPDPTATWCAQFEVGVAYTVAVFNRVGVTEVGQAAIDIYQ